MLLYFRMAARNLFRMPRRTLTTGLTIAACVAALIIMRSLVIGSDRDMKERFLSTHYPDLYVFSENYQGCKGHCLGSLENLLGQTEDVIKAFESEDSFKVVTPRLKFTARLSDGVDLIPCQIIACRPSREKKLFKNVKLVDGRWLQDDDDAKALLGVFLAKSMGIEIGSTITLLAQSCEGALSAVDVKVVGTMFSNNPYADGETVYLPLDTGRRLAETNDDECSHLCIRTAELKTDYGEVFQRAAKRSGQKLASMTWYDRTSWIRSLTARRSAGVAIAAFFMALTVVIGVANSILMAVYERHREIGTLMAIGFTRLQIVLLFVTEGFSLGCMAATLGALVGSAGAHYYETVGLSLNSDPVTMMAHMPKKIYALLTPETVLYAFLFGVLVVTLSSIYPAIHGSSLVPAESLRKS